MERNDSPSHFPKRRNMSTHLRDIGKRMGGGLVGAPSFDTVQRNLHTWSIIIDGYEKHTVDTTESKVRRHRSLTIQGRLLEG